MKLHLRMLSWTFKSCYPESLQRVMTASLFFKTSLQYKSLTEQLDLKMKIFCQITILILAALIAVTSFNCSLAATVTVTLREENFISTSKIVSVTSASDVKSTTNIDSSYSHMTISLTNVYETQLSLSFASNADGSFPIDNSFVIILSNASPIQYTFPTEWTERIYVGSNLNPDGSKIEGSYTDSSDIDVSYVDDYSVLITCSFEGTAVFGCNINLFKQSGITCNNQVDGSVCLNFAQSVADEFASPFFAACAEAAYIYSNDNDANVSNLESNVVFCCIDTSCKAFSRQSSKQGTSQNDSEVQRQSASSSFLLSFARKRIVITRSILESKNRFAMQIG